MLGRACRRADGTGVEGGQHAHQFVDPVGAGMAGPDGLEPVGHQGATQVRIVAQSREMPLHGGRRVGHQEIAADIEQRFAVAPGR